MSADQHRYKLEKGARKFKICPQCHKKEFVRYIDTENNNEYLADHVGRCNREQNCTYHFTPKEYFAETGTKPTNLNESDTYQPIRKQAPPAPVMTHIPGEVLTLSLKSHENNTFVKYLLTLFDGNVVKGLIDTYRIGSSNGGKWWNDKENIPVSTPGSSAVFWFINKENQIRYGQVKHFTNGHTSKYYDFKKEDCSSCTTGVYYLIKDTYRKVNRALPDWLTKYIEYGEYGKQINCFYGEHLLSIPEYQNKPIAIVEAPKTAIIASIYFPSFAWLGVGALSYLTPDRCEVLKGKNVKLFPDLGAFTKWSDKASELQHIANFSVSDILEQRATPEQRARGLDLADYVDTPEFKAELRQAYSNSITNLIAGKEAAQELTTEAVQIFFTHQAKGLRLSDAQQVHGELIEAARQQEQETTIPIIENEIKAAA